MRLQQLWPIESLLVSAFFRTSPNVISGYISVWAQSASVFLIPPILLVAMIAPGMRDGWPRVVLAWLAGFLAALLLIQDLYTAQFAQLEGMAVARPWGSSPPFRTTLRFPSGRRILSAKRVQRRERARSLSS